MPDLQSSLYVGHMGVENGGERIVCRGFKATAEKLVAQDIVGSIVLTKRTGAWTVESIASLGSLRIVSSCELINPEFMLLFDQTLTGGQKSMIAEMGQDYDLGFDLSGVSVPVASADEKATLPLWDGIRLYREPGRLLTGRHHEMKLRKVIKPGETLGMK